MKSRKGISVLLSLLLVFNVFLNGSIKVKAEEITNSIEVLSVSVDKTNVDINKEVNITVEAKSTLADLANEAYGVYTLKTDKPDPIEKELILTFDKSDMKYHGKIAISDESLVGLWSISWLSVSDVLGNTVAVYNSKVHGEIGQDLSAGNFNLFVDKNGPTLSKINLSKQAAKAGDNVNINIEANDDLSGLASTANLVYVLKTDSGDVEKEVTLSLKDNKYTGNFAINKTSFQEGLWQLSYIALCDNSSNSIIIYNSNVHENLGQDLKDGNLLVDYQNPEKPQISLSTTKPTNQNVKVTITSEKDAKIEYQLEGQSSWTEYKGTFEVEKNTKLQARATDLAGNVGEISEVEISNIDKVAPIVTIENLDKEYYNVNVLPVIKVDDNTATKTVLLNGIPYIGTEITSEGEYTLKVMALDNADNLTEVTKKFTIDKTAPIINVEGVQNGKAYKTAQPEVVSNEENVDTKLFLNGNPYDGKAISQDGEYELMANVTDRAGNTSSITVKFVVDNVKPVISVGGVDSNKVYVNCSVTPNVQVNEDAKVTITLDGVVYNGKEPIKATGDHKLVITAIDNAGNEAVKEVSFTLKAVVTADKQSSADYIKDLVKSSKANESVVINANDNPTITTNVLEALKGIDKPISFVVESQGMTLTWTFNGKDIIDTTKSVDLTLNASAPNKDLITKVDSNAEIISFKNHGTLPAAMTVTIPVDTKKFDVTKPLYFYYYNETTKKAELIAEGLKAYQKGDAYYVDVTITHCSDYFLSGNDSKTVLPKVEKLVQTGSPVDMNVLVALGMLLIGAGFTTILARRKRSQQ